VRHRRGGLAEAAAIILAGDGHVGRTYTLGGSHTTSLADIATVLSTATGKDIDYVDVSIVEFVTRRLGEGLPDVVAPFLAAWFTAMKLGEFSEVAENRR
jgi:NAD(P)H dehydrogenase (quinone)